MLFPTTCGKLVDKMAICAMKPTIHGGKVSVENLCETNCYMQYP